MPNYTPITHSRAEKAPAMSRIAWSNSSLGFVSLMSGSLFKNFVLHFSLGMDEFIKKFFNSKVFDIRKKPKTNKHHKPRLSVLESDH